MLQVTKLIVLINFFMIISADILNALEIDINNQNVIKKNIPVGKFTIIEFPFILNEKNIKIKIKRVENQKLDLYKSNKLIKEINTEEEKNLLELKNKVKTVSGNKKPLPVVSKNIGKKGTNKIIHYEKNLLQIYPKNAQTYEIAALGATKPIIITLNAKNADVETSFFKLKDSKKKITSESVDFVTINDNNFFNLLRYLYVNKDPKGFEKVEENFINIPYYDGKINCKLLKHYKNQKYELKEYLLSSKFDSFYINEDLFKEERTRVISFDTQDNFIYKNQTIRYFLINSIKNK